MNLRTLAIAFAGLATFTTAQEAKLDVVRGCTFPGPADSLRGAYLDPEIWVADQNDFVAFEIESAKHGHDGWILENDPNKPGFSGTGYFRWNSGHRMNPGEGHRTYRMFLHSGGTYRINIHNRHDNPIVSDGNDCWLRVNGGEWFKAFSNDGSNVGVWNWHFRKSPRNNQYESASFVAGINTIEISARSTGFMLDRVHVYRAGFPYADLSLPISEKLRSRPIQGEMLTLDLDDPNNEAGLPAGTTQGVLFANLVAPAACGVALPGFGPTGGNGEFLLGLNPVPFALTTAAAPWGGPGNPARFSLPVPNDPNIVGFVMHVQGALADLNGPRAVLTDGAKLTFGSF